MISEVFSSFSFCSAWWHLPTCAWHQHCFYCISPDVSMEESSWPLCNLEVPGSVINIRKILRGNKILNTSWKCTEHPAKDHLHLHVSARTGTKGSDSNWGESIDLEYLLEKLKYKLWNFVSCHWLYHPSVSARNIIWTCVYFLLAFENNVFILFH